jgi:DNA-binding SARP family transcriptional activator
MFRLETLGSLVLTDGPAAVVSTPRRRLALLALLAVGAERGLTRDKLIAYLWPESAGENARHALEQLVYGLRRQLGDTSLLGPDPLRLNPGIITTDVTAFGQAIARGEPADAVALYRGPFLDGFFLNDAPTFERWAEDERARLAGKYRSALECLAAAARDSRAFEAEVRWRRRLATADPLSAGTTVSLLRALAAAGDRAGALQHARVYESLVREELDSGPDPAVLAVVEELRAGALPASLDPPSASRDTPARGEAAAGELGIGDPVAIATRAPGSGRRRAGPSARGFAVGLSVAVAVVALAAGGLLRWERPPLPSGDPRVVAVLPFRATGADSGLGYLREGMVDLLAAKLTGDGGPRAIDPRTLLGAWHRAASTNGGELSADAAMDLARRLGAGRLVDGGIVGTPRHLVLTACLVNVPDGATRARVSVAGTMDSLPGLVDRLTAALLAGESGRTELATLTSLAALRAYLDGQAELRAGRFTRAFQSFTRALEVDSAFALAGIGLGRARFWGGGNDSGRGFRLAWAARDRLSPRDRAVIAPWMVPGPQHLAAARAAVVAMPESPEAWYELGDDYYHGGASMGVDAPLRRAAEAFRRALELDSTFAESRMHLFDLSVAIGDTAEVRRLGTLILATDSANDFAGYLRWQMAYALHDSATLAAVRARFARMDDRNLRTIVFRSLETGAALDDARRALAIMRGRADSDSARARVRREDYELALNAGRPREALALAVESERRHDQVGNWSGRVTDALYWDGDQAGAARWVRRLSPHIDGPLATDPEERRTQYDDLCTLEQWRLAHGDVAHTESAIRRLRAARVPGPPGTEASAAMAHASLCAEVLNAWLAGSVRRPDGPELARRMDSVARARPEGWWSDGWNLVVARLLQDQGDEAAALALVRRRRFGLVPPPYLSTYLRMEGHLAALTGDTAAALLADRRYLALRSHPEPALLAQRDSVQAELAALLRP